MRRDIDGMSLSGDKFRLLVGIPSSVTFASEELGRCGETPASGISCYIEAMNRIEALETLRRSESDLRARGVRRAAVFGSVARGDSRPDSDIDIMVEIDPEAHLTVFDYAGLKDYIASLFDGPVDVVNRDGLRPYVRPVATADAIYAF